MYSRAVEKKIYSHRTLPQMLPRARSGMMMDLGSCILMRILLKTVTRKLTQKGQRNNQKSQEEVNSCFPHQLNRQRRHLMTSQTF
jgi:hypothetical protein